MLMLSKMSTFLDELPTCFLKEEKRKKARWFIDFLNDCFYR